MSHLGDTGSAFVDGALDAETAWRVSAHVAKCRSCRAEVEAERALKTQLAVPAQALLPLPSGLASALLGIAVGPLSTGHGDGSTPPASSGIGHGSTPMPPASSRRPAARVVQAAPRGRGDVGGPGRSARSGPRVGGRYVRGRYVAAAGLAASVMVGLGGGALGGGALSGGVGTLAGGPSGPAASTSATATGGSLAVPTTASTAVPASLSSLLPVAGRSIVRSSTRAALSVVYRQP